MIHDGESAYCPRCDEPMYWDPNVAEWYCLDCEGPR